MTLSLTRAEATTSRAVATTKINRGDTRTETKTTERMAGTAEVPIEKAWAQKWANTLLDPNAMIATDTPILVLMILRGARLRTKW